MHFRGLEHWWRGRMRRRPWWVNALFLVSVFMAVVAIPLDFLCTPMARDEQVWFGITLRGGWAKLGEVAHWLVYAAGAYGFWHLRSWMWPWAALYAGQVAFSMFVWFLVHRGGVRGALAAIVSAALYGAIARLLWRARPLFHALRQPLRARYGEWALVTGASSGIGAEFARALARDGMSVVLSARRADRLRALADEIERAGGVRTRVVPVDLGAADGAERLVEAVADLDIAVLVANAGAGLAGRFEHQDPQRLRDMIQLNCAAPVVLAGRLIGPMQALGRGAIIIVSSTAGHQPVPFHAVYGASKGFDLQFGEALWAEMQGTGVDVLVVQPGPTATEFQAAAGESPHEGEPPAQVVGIALHALGQQPSVISGWFNWLRAQTCRVAPRSLVALVAGRVMAQWVPDE